MLIFQVKHLILSKNLFNKILVEKINRFQTNHTKMRPYDSILKYWFGEDLSLLKSDNYKGNNSLWFGSKPETDEYIKENFLPYLNEAENDKLNEWKSETQGSLALIILLDQFSRNVYRGTSKMFTNDPKALSISLDIIKDVEKLNGLSQPEKFFVYMPLMHAEDEKISKQCCDAFEKMIEEAPENKKNERKFAHKFALEHYDIIKQFGRFPHRNEILGRPSTKEELEYLANSNVSFASSVKPANKSSS
jgi:uncharacterized protein (DUF924 family)